MTERPNCDRRWRIQAATDEGLLPQDAREANGWAEYAEDGCMVKNIRINRQPNACFSRPIDLKFERALLGIVRGRKAAPSVSIYQGIDDVSVAGLARVLLGSHEGANSSIESPSEINYLAGRLVAGERWRYAPPAGHAVLRTAVCKGAVRAPDRIEQGELAIFAPSEAAVEFLAEVDTEFMRGSAMPHPHDLVLGYYSVHTSADALARGEHHIREIRAELVRQARLGRL